MQTKSHTSERLSRVPNGAADQRLRVALPPPLLSQIQQDATRNMRTVSAMAALIIAEHYRTNPVTKE